MTFTVWKNTRRSWRIGWGVGVSPSGTGEQLRTLCVSLHGAAFIVNTLKERAGTR